MKIPKMTAKMAVAISDWATSTEVVTVTVEGGGSPRPAHLLSVSVHRPIIDFLSNTFGNDQLHLSQKGLVISKELVSPLVTVAMRKYSSANFKKAERERKAADRARGLVEIARSRSAASQSAMQSWEESIKDSARKRWLCVDEPPRTKPDWVLADSAALRNAIADASDLKDKLARKQTLQKLLDRIDRRVPRVNDEHLVGLQNLKVQFPNFVEVLDRIHDHFCLLKLTDEPMGLPPFLLLGPPGVGKTYFVKTLCSTLSMNLEMRSMAETTASFVITGSSSTWSGSKIGAVAALVINAPDNSVPVLMLDEIDKALTGNYSAANAMLGLLEPHTAKVFRDEFLDVEMDVRPMAILMTANVAPPKDSPLGSRATVIDIPAPTAEQMPRIVLSVDQSLRKERPGIAERFSPLTDELILRISASPPRELRKCLEKAYATAARSARALDSDNRLLTLEDSHFLLHRREGGGLQPTIGSRASPLDARQVELPLLVIDTKSVWRLH